MDAKINAINFSNWLGDKGYKKVSIYTKYKQEEGTWEVFPDYDTFYGTFWSQTSQEEIAQIMFDNDNEEFAWVLENVKTIEQLYEEFENGTK